MAPVLMRQEDIDFWRGGDVRMKAASAAIGEVAQGLWQGQMIEPRVRFPYSRVSCHQQQHWRRRRLTDEVSCSIEWRKVLNRGTAVALLQPLQLHLLMKLLA